MDFLAIKGKTFLVTGVANKKSVAYHSASLLKEAGARLILAVQHEEAQRKAEKLFPESRVYIVDVQKECDLEKLEKSLKEDEIKLSGLLHSIAFANLSEPKPFHETQWRDYSEANQISCFSLVSLSNYLKDLFERDASVVTISISNTKATSYGYMGPIKASLDATVAYLAKSFSAFSEVRFNAICSGPLKTSASAGIPGYINNYLFAEKLTLRKKALKTEEVASSVAFLLSSRSSGINGTGVVIDAGMNCNYFDEEVVDIVSRD